jgi:hypothetical protein
MNALIRITLFCVFALLVSKVNAQPIKIIDPSNQYQVLVLSTMWCKKDGFAKMYQYGKEVSRDSTYAPGNKCYQVFDDKKYILLDSEKIPYDKIQVLDIKSGKGVSTVDFNTEQGRKRIYAEQDKQIDRLREASHKNYPIENITPNPNDPSLYNLPATASSSNNVATDPVVKQLTEKCQVLGFVVGTEQMKQCLLQMHSNQQQENIAAAQQQAADAANRQQQLRNAAELLRGDGRTPGSMNCYGTPGGAGGIYCR